MNFLNKLKESNTFSLTKENIFFILIITIAFTLDRITKYKILNNYSDSTYFINDYLNLDLIWNIGIGFGFLSTETSLIYNFITFIIGIFIIVLILISVTTRNLEKIIYGLIIGGALGNFYDRLIFQAVPDFIDIHINDLHWFRFNVADIFISIGIIGFIFESSLKKKN